MMEDARRCKKQPLGSVYCLVSQYQKGGVREAEAGNHPRGEGGEAGGREQTKSR